MFLIKNFKNKKNVKIKKKYTLPNLRSIGPDILRIKRGYDWNESSLIRRHVFIVIYIHGNPPPVNLSSINIIIISLYAHRWWVLLREMHVYIMFFFMRVYTWIPEIMNIIYLYNRCIYTCNRIHTKLLRDVYRCTDWNARKRCCLTY